MGISWNLIGRLMDSLAQMPERARAVQQEYTAGVATLASDADTSEAYKTYQAEQRQQAAAAKLQELLNTISQFASTIAGESPDTPASGDALADELRVGRAWGRAKTQLDAGLSWQSIMNTAVDQKDAATLQALREEMPAWLAAASAGIPGKPFLSTVDSAVVSAEFQKLVKIAFARAFPDSDEGRLYGVQLRSDLLAQIADNEAATSLKVVSGVGGDSLLAAVTTHYLRQDLTTLEDQLSGAEITPTGQGSTSLSTALTTHYSPKGN